MKKMCGKRCDREEDLGIRRTGQQNTLEQCKMGPKKKKENIVRG